MSSEFDIRLTESQEKLFELKSAIATMCHQHSFCKEICVYVCGSLGRLEMTGKSDLDLFFITTARDLSTLHQHIFFANLYQINQTLKYTEPSKQGLYWEFIPKENLLDIGSRKEDYNNSFTARMLLLLESKPLFNEDAYTQLVKETIERYFTDYEEYKDDFHPLFLMNDILRYWYTLTLNYEYRRDPKDGADEKNWKRLKLKYPRLITCFSLLACLYKARISPADVAEYVKMTPFQRLHVLAEDYGNIKETVEDIQKQYEWFISLRQYDPGWWDIEGNKSLAMSNAEHFHDTVIHSLMKKISENNPVLRRKVDVY